MGKRYQVKHRGKLIGDGTLAELKEQAQRGQLTPFHKISSDGVEWQSASDFPELFGQAPPLPAAPAPASAPAPQPTPAPPSVPAPTSGAPLPAAAPAADPVPVVVEEPAAPQELEWHLTINQEPYGPFNNSEVVEYIREGRISPGDSIWRDGFADWVPVDKVFSYEINKVRRARRKQQKREAKQKKKEAYLKSLPPADQRSYSILALASMALSVVWVLGLASIAGVALGILGIYEIQTSKGYKTGLGFAVVGVILGLLGAGLGVFLIFILPSF